MNGCWEPGNPPRPPLRTGVLRMSGPGMCRRPSESATRARTGPAEGQDTGEPTTTRVAPKGAWQSPHPSLTACTRHRNLCAYRQSDPERCDHCHARWDLITGPWAETPEQHTAEHVAEDETRSRARARNAS